MFKRLSKVLLGAMCGIAIIMSCPKNINAASIDAAMAMQAASLTPEQIQQLWLSQQALLLNNQQAILDQYAKAFTDQYAKGLFVQQAFSKQQLEAIQQYYLLNAVQIQQAAQLQALLNANVNTGAYTGLPEFQQAQQEALKAFLAYEGLKK